MAHVHSLGASSYGRTSGGFRRFRLPALARRISLSQQRRQLAQLDPAQLADIGLSAEQARAEASRGFWDAPDWWHHN